MASGGCARRDRRGQPGPDGRWPYQLHTHPVHLVTHFRNAFAELPPVYAYAALFGILIFEGTGLPLVPFEPLFIATAYLVGHGRLHFWPLVLAGAGGDFLGNLIGYQIGRTAGRLVLDRYGRRLRLDDERMAAAERWFWRFGGGTVFLGRFFGPIRTPAILLAGLSRMPLQVYAIWCGAADLLWVGAWQVGLLHFSHLALDLWRRFGTPTFATAFGLLVLAAAIAYWRWRRRGGMDRGA